MKKNMILAFALAVILSSCNDSDTIWDFITPDVEFIVTDEQGNDMLDPERAGNLLRNEITVTYQGDTYVFNESGIESRESMPLPLAIRHRYSTYWGSYVIAFGEFSPTSNYRNESFEIDWGDGRPTDRITFDLYTTWKKNNPTVHKKLQVNGVVMSTKELVAVLEKPNTIIWDLAPLSVQFIVCDSQGNDLLAEGTTGNLLSNDIQVIYADKTYSLGDPEPELRYILPRPLALRLEPNPTEYNLLSFGEFDPYGEYDRTEFRIDWGNGITDLITFSFELTWEKGWPIYNRRIWLNDQIHSEEDFLIYRNFP